MTNLKTYLAENTDYLGDLAAPLESLTEAEWVIVQEASEELTGDKDAGMSCTNLVLTGETVDHWREASKNWNECSKTYNHKFSGFDAAEFSAAQARKGDQRHEILVVDLGDRRMVLWA